jgi:OOP family OmpA-OmpF porin
MARKKTGKRALFASLGGVAALFAAGSANAQTSTFHLDRLEVPGAPDDGLVLMRPVTQPKTIFFGQLALGYSRDPLHTSNITNDGPTLKNSDTAVIRDQFTEYATIGFQFLNRVTIAATLPATLVQDGSNPNYATGVFGGTTSSDSVQTSGPALDDLRLDARAVIARTNNERGAVGAALSFWAPTGSTANFGGDGQATIMPSIQGEYDFKYFILDANTGVAFRPDRHLNQPANADNGLGVGDEWRWAVGGFVPLKGGKYRLGATIFGQTGLENSAGTDNQGVGNTIFTKRNTPIEWNVEGRMKLGPKDRWWVGFGGGTLIANGYGAPDLRLVGMVGAFIPILDTDANSPDRKEALRAKWKEEGGSDRDHDGIPDDYDACPDDPEDHLGDDPSDGCPLPPDRDGDGIPDMYDKCPDQPEDKDGVDDGDGCPETDADNDGIPDAQDACPKDPGKPNPDPKKNGCPLYIAKEGSVVRVLQQVHFKTGSAQILPDSFPMLQEIVDLLKADQGIKRMSIEGHTDNKGKPENNKVLSQNRANSVMAWLTSHGVTADRLEAHGFGQEKPIDTNDTDEGRQANRRVEFKILDEEDTNKAPKK